MLKRPALPTTIELYRSRVARGDLGADPAQERVAERLDALGDELAHAAERGPGLGRLFGFRAEPQTPRGLYLVGDVGRGKTMLMDLFFEAAPVARKRRVHFHAFMADVHGRIHDWRQRSRRGLVRGDDPIAPVADVLAQEAKLLCFDEFAVTDIADAMILGRLFTRLFADGVVVVATSNVEPDRLYEGGLNRALFLPFIESLKRRMEIMRLDAAQDYRFSRLADAETWMVPADGRARNALDRAFLSLTGVAHGSRLDLPLLGRTLAVPEAAGSAARFPAAALFEAPLASADFLAIARAFATVIVDGIRVIGADERNVAKRFVTAVDTFYDEGVKLLASADAEPEALYAAEDGRELFEFRRTVSRLREMRTADYLARPHGHGRLSPNTAGIVET